MHLVLARRIVLILMAFLLIGLCIDDANAQKRRKKKSRRVTNPVTTTQQSSTPSANSSDPQIISTADDASYNSSTTSARRNSSGRNSATTPGDDGTRDKVDKLTAQVSALNEKLSQMELQQRTLVDLERLSRAETRGEGLRVQLRDVQAKEAELQTRTLQLDYDLQPAVIERTLAVSGSTRPEDLREQRRRALETEKNNTQTQLNQLATSRARLETAIANAEAEADRLRARIDTVLDPQTNEPATTDVGTPPEAPTGAGDKSYGRP